MQLKSISTLFDNKERELKKIVENLEYKQIKTDIAFNETIKSLEKKFILEKVEIGEPKIINHRVEERATPPNYRNLYGGPQQFNIVSVAFPCKGSRELFEYRGTGSLTIAQIYPPDGDQIVIEVILDKLDKAAATTGAMSEIRTTKELIKMNNPEIENWSKAMKSKIREILNSKRVELKEFYS